MRTLSKRWFAAGSIALLGGLGSCGGGSTDGNALDTIGGEITTTTFVLPAGQTRTVTSSLTITTSQGIQIDGTLLLAPGVSLALLAKGDLNVNGSIQPAAITTKAAGHSLSRADPPPPQMIINPGNGSIGPTGKITGLPGESIFISTRDSTGKFVVAGTISTGNGKDAANKSDDGQPGGSIEIGTDDAVNAVQKKHSTGAQPDTIVVTGSLKAGSGGKGFDDPGRHEMGMLTVHCTSGGQGGSLTLSARKSVDLTKAQGLVAGAGGAGGTVGTTTLQATDGKQPGEKGESVFVLLGSGGRGGDFSAGPDQTHNPAFPGGQGGPAGSYFASAGNGGSGGDGGDILLYVGEPGEGGYGDVAKKGGITASLDLQGGLGGDAQDAQHPGGNAGEIVIRPTTKSGTGMWQGRSRNTFSESRAGTGFNGCVYYPLTDGSNGGNGTNVSSNPNLPASVSDGANGGNGKAIAGKGGHSGKGAAGKNGAGGVLCTFVPQTLSGQGYIAVVLDQDLPYQQLGYSGTLKAGTTIPLVLVNGGRTANKDSCPADHFHGTITAIRGVEFNAPFQDPNPTGCGYGKLTVVKEARILGPNGKEVAGTGVGRSSARSNP